MIHEAGRSSAQRVSRSRHQRDGASRAGALEDVEGLGRAGRRRRFARVAGRSNVSESLMSGFVNSQGNGASGVTMSWLERPCSNRRIESRACVEWVRPRQRASLAATLNSMQDVRALACASTRLKVFLLYDKTL